MGHLLYVRYIVQKKFRDREMSLWLFATRSLAVVVRIVVATSEDLKLKLKRSALKDWG